MTDDKYKAAVDEIKMNHGLFTDDLFSIIDRLALGNPRLTKKERKALGELFTALIGQLGLSYTVAAKLNEIRGIVAETSEHKSTVVSLFEERAKLTMQTYKILRRFLRVNEVNEALDMLDELIKNLDE